TFSGHLDPVAAAPLVPGAFLITTPPDPAFADAIEEEIGFGEVYWAVIPRGPARDRYTLEEAKKWARTVVERARLMEKTKRDEEPAPAPEAAAGAQRQQREAARAPEYARATQVIAEMIETIRVLGHLL